MARCGEPAGELSPGPGNLSSWPEPGPPPPILHSERSSLTAATTTTLADDPHGYSARHLSVLEGLEAVRKRPGMYIGSTDSRGLVHLLWEIVDNSVDEALAGHCTRVEVVMHADGSIQVDDDGRGIPVDAEPKTGLTGVELVMTRLHAGGKFGGISYTASGGLHGVGASVVNALSARLDVEVDREGHTHAMSFKRGLPGEFGGAGPDAKFKKKSGMRQTKRVAKKITGTRIRFWPDRQIFLRDATIATELVLDRMRQTAFLVPGLSISVRDERGAEPVEETFRFDGGISEFCEHLAADQAVCDVLRIQGRGHFTETVPVLDDQGHLTPTDVERDLEVDVALRWGTGYDTVCKSFVNVIATPKHGTHVAGFDRALVRTVNEALRNTRLLKNGDEPVVKEDVLEGLTAVVTVRLPEPQFEGQTKEVLGTSAATRIVSQIVGNQLRDAFENPKRGQKQPMRTVLEKVVAAAKTRLAARTQRDNQRRKNALENSALPAKLVDCRTADDRSELFIVEGDSALGTAKLARNSEFQALLPIRGKILNVQKASVADMLKNAECAAIIQVLGAGSGRGFDLDQTRYGRVILMSVAPDEPALFTDADGRFVLRRIGPAIDDQIESGGHNDLAGTVSVDLTSRAARISPVKQFIRHRHAGPMYRIKTVYGRNVAVTGGHSVFTYEEGRLTLKPAHELGVGDIVVAPRQLPRPEPQSRIDLALLLQRAGQDKAIRIEGEPVRRLMMEKLAIRQPSALRRDEERVRLPAKEWRRLAALRMAKGITGAQMAKRIGYRQACSVSEFETCRSLPPASRFQRYIDELGEPWPQGVELVASVIEQWACTASKNERYRNASAAVWLSDLSETDLAWLDGEPDADELRVYPRAHRDDAVPRYLPITDDLCYVLGWYLAEGSLSCNGARLNFALGRDDDSYLDGLRSAITRLVGHGPVTVYPKGRPNSIHLYVHAPIFARLAKALEMGGRATEKRVPDLLLNCSEEHQLAFLEGYYLGGGTKERQGKKIVFRTSSRDLANSLLYLLGQLGVIASLHDTPGGVFRTNGRESHTKPGYIVCVSSKEGLRKLRSLWRKAPCADAYDQHIGSDNTRSSFEDISPELVGLPIREIEVFDYDGDVYDLSVPEDENFISGTGGLLTHNTDADVDGAHIRCLLITLIHSYMRPLLEAGRVFAAVPPLHRIELTRPKKGQDKYIYTYSDSELRRRLVELERRGHAWKEPIQRYKGLGEMDAGQLAETTMDPQHRMLRRIRIEDAEEAAKIFDLLMGSDVAPRREFITAGAAELDAERIDT
jgi:DNA gyrase subunit B